MKKVFLFLCAALLSGAPLFSQETSAESYHRRYNMLVEKVGVDGLGVETLLGKWEKDFPDDPEMLTSKFLFYSAKAVSSRVIQLSQDKYLGRSPLIPFTDSTGVKRNYFEDTVYDEDMLAIASKALNRAIAIRPERMDYQIARMNTLLSYEKESPEMTLSALQDVVRMTYEEGHKWTYPELEGELDRETFKAFMQDYCVAFFKIASPGSYEAFRQLSELMLKYEGGDPLFLDNLGSYYLVFKKDSKTALKYYNKVLKKHPDDLTALQNCVILARREKNAKMEKKFRERLEAAQKK